MLYHIESHEVRFSLLRNSFNSFIHKKNIRSYKRKGFDYSDYKNMKTIYFDRSNI